MVDPQAQAGDIGIGHFTEDHRHVGGGSARAAVLDRHVGQDHAHLATGQPGLAVGLVLLAPLLFTRRQGVGNETADAVGERRDLIVQPGRAVVVQHAEYLGMLCIPSTVPYVNEAVPG
ncbi:hypothetical protein D9M70_530780 [compost metagenome]